MESAFDRNRRVAWIMESAEFSIRRLGERISPYLTDRRVYDQAPQGPGCRKPARNLIDDFGPFAWKIGMRYPDGEKIPSPTWTKHSMYFLGRESEVTAMSIREPYRAPPMPVAHRFGSASESRPRKYMECFVQVGDGIFSPSG